MHDNTAQVREDARKRGGEELLAKVDAAIATAAEFEKTLKERLEQALAIEDKDTRLYAVVGVVEALSTAFGQAAVAYGNENKTHDSQVMVLAIRSIVNSIQTAQDDRDAKSGDVLAAIKKGFNPDNFKPGDDK